MQMFVGWMRYQPKICTVYLQLLIDFPVATYFYFDKNDFRFWLSFLLERPLQIPSLSCFEIFGVIAIRPFSCKNQETVSFLRLLTDFSNYSWNNPSRWWSSQEAYRLRQPPQRARKAAECTANSWKNGRMGPFAWNGWLRQEHPCCRRYRWPRYPELLFSRRCVLGVSRRLGWG